MPAMFNRSLSSAAACAPAWPASAKIVTRLTPAGHCQPRKPRLRQSRNASGVSHFTSARRIPDGVASSAVFASPKTVVPITPDGVPAFASSMASWVANNVRVERRLVGLGDAAKYLGVSTDTVAGMLDRGILHRVVLPGVRRLLLDVHELDRVIEAGRAA